MLPKTGIPCLVCVSSSRIPIPLPKKRGKAWDQASLTLGGGLHESEQVFPVFVQDRPVGLLAVVVWRSVSIDIFHNSIAADFKLFRDMSVTDACFVKGFDGH